MNPIPCPKCNGPLLTFNSSNSYCCADCGNSIPIEQLTQIPKEQPMIDKWDARFLKIAKEASEWSKDPSTKCGCVIVRPDKSIVSTGYNGFPRGCEDKEDLLNNREKKYRRIIHAEMNAILQAKTDLTGCTLYVWPFMTCERCAVHVIQAGITRVVAPAVNNERWNDSIALSEELYKECGVDYEYIGHQQSWRSLWSHMS